MSSADPAPSNPSGPLSPLERIIRWWHEAKRPHVLRTAMQESPKLSTVLVAATVGSALAPLALAAALAHLVSQLADAKNLPTGSLVFVGLAFLATAFASVIHASVGKLLSVRLTQAMQASMMDAVNAPIGISHVSSATVRADLAAAQGALGSYFPAEAPLHISVVAAIRMTAAITVALIAVLATPWLAIELTVTWIVVRYTLRRNVLAAVQSFGGEAEPVSHARYLETLLTSPANAKEIRIFGIDTWLLERFRTTWMTSLRGMWTALGRLRTAALWQGALAAVAYGAAYWWVIGAARNGRMSLGIATFLILVLPAVSGFAILGESGVFVEFMLDSFPRFDLASPTTERTEPPASPTSSVTPTSVNRITSAPPNISFEEVTFGYPGAHDLVLNRLNLTIEGGRSTALVGVNGVGKSTIVRLIARLHDPTSGRILIDGSDLATLDGEGWRSRLAYVFQEFVHLPASALENVALGRQLEQATDDEVLSVLGEVGLGKRLATLPNGLATPLTPELAGGVDLSGGEWQRVALARVLLAVRRGADVLVLDEPTSALDPLAERDLYGSFLEMSAGRTTILTSHRFSTVRQADRIVVLSPDGIKEDGAHDELIKHGGHYAEMYALQANAFVG